MIALAAFLTLIGLVFVACAPAFAHLARVEGDRLLRASAWLIAFASLVVGGMCITAAILTFTA